MEKKYRLKPDQIKLLIKSNQGCVATDRITVDGMPVGYMHREEPFNDDDSGWRFFAGDESDLYLNLAQNHGYHPLNVLCNFDPTIIPYVESEYPCAFLRLEGDDAFEEVDFDSDEEEADDSLE